MTPGVGEVGRGRPDGPDRTWRRAVVLVVCLLVGLAGVAPAVAAVDDTASPVAVDGTDAATVAAGSNATETRVFLSPTEASVTAGGNVTYDVVVANATHGVGTADYILSLGNASAARFADAAIAGDFDARPPLSSINVTNDSVAMNFVSADTVNGTNVTVGRVTVAGRLAGSTSVGLAVDTLGDERSRSYAVTASDGATLTVRPDEPDVELSPATGVEFGTVAVGTTANVTVTVANNGTTDLTVSDVRTTGPFAVNGSMPVRLAPGNATRYVVTFAPAANGSVNGTLVVESDDPDAPNRTLSLSGTGLTAPALAVPARADAGSVPLGSTGTTTLTVTNAGTAPLSVSGLSVGGPDAAAFATTNATFTLAPGATRTVNVTFAPARVGNATATLSVASNDSQSPTDVTLAGTGVGVPQVNVSTGRVDFGTPRAGSTASRTVTVTNTGTGPLSVAGVAVRNASAVSVAGVPGSIDAGGSATLSLTYAPTAGGTLDGTLLVNTSDSDDPSVAVALDGRARAPDVVLSNSSVAFGQIPVGESRNRTLTVRNAGDATLNVSGVSVGAAELSASLNATTLAPGSSATLTVTAAPTASGPIQSSLTVASDDPDEPTVSAQVTATGVTANRSVPEVVVSPTTVDFGLRSVSAGNGTRTLTVRNDGTGPLAVSVPANASGPFRTRGIDTTLAPGTNATLTLVFVPTTTGATFNRTLSISTNDSDAATVPVTLVGEVGTGGGGGGGGGGFTPAPAPVPTTPEETTNGSAAGVPSASGDGGFGDVSVGSTAATTVTVENVGSGNLTLAGTSIAGANASAFSVQGSANDTLGPGETTTLTVRFAPTAAGVKAALLSVDSANGTATMSLSGTATRTDASVSPGSVDFQRVRVGERAVTTISVTNNGTTPLTFQDPTLSGSGADQFAVAGGDFTLDPGASTTLGVAFAPDAAGDHAATVGLRSDAGRLTVGLSGSAVAPEISVTPGHVDFGNVSVGTSVTETVTVRNAGTANLSVSNVAIVGTDASAFSVDGDAFSLGPGERETLAVTFAPESGTPKSAHLRIFSDGIDGGVADVWLTNTRTIVDVGGRDGNDTRVDVSVVNAEAGQHISINTSRPDDDTENVSLTGVNMTVERDGNFTLNITVSDDTLSTTPAFTRQDRNGTVPVGHIRINHSIPNAEVGQANFRFRVRKSSLNGSDPGDVALYRYTDRWEELDTTVVRETHEYFVLLAESPGMSEFTSGVKKAEFDVTQATVNVQKITAGDSVEVRVRITNDGEADGTFQAKLLLNERVVERSRVTIAAGGTRQVTFDREFPDPGTYEVLVNEVPAGEVTVTESDTEDGTTTTASDGDGGAGDGDAETADGGDGDPGDTTPTSSGGGLPGFGVGTALVALVVGLLVAVVRRD